MSQENAPQKGKKIRLALSIWITLLLATLPFFLSEKTRVYAAASVAMLVGVLVAVVIIGSASMIAGSSFESN